MNALRALEGFLSFPQSRAMAAASGGPEGEWFREKADELAEVIRAMPRTYQTDGQGTQAIAYLHYFRGGADWYITEKDAGCSDSNLQGQHHAFGLADMTGDGGELGYISIVELVQNGVELDLHWAAKPLAECRNRRARDVALDALPDEPATVTRAA